MDLKKDGQKNFNVKIEQRLLQSPRMDKDQFELTRAWLVAAIVIAVILLSGGYMLSKHNASLGMATTSAESALLAGAATPTSSNDSVTIKDQAAGATVVVANMSLSKLSWIAVRDAKTHWILGARWFGAGQTKGDVYLLKPTVTGGKYEGVIYVDDGDKKFDLHKDTLEDGIVSPFTAE